MPTSHHLTARGRRAVCAAAIALGLAAGFSVGFFLPNPLDECRAGACQPLLSTPSERTP